MYLALYRKYRPKDFEDVISQPHITTTLANEIKTNHIAHAYLFTGSRGTGKTTCSQILAKAVNCLEPKEGQPCHECDICKGIEDGSILDVVEIDAASNNGVDNIRDLRDEANFTPVSCKYRVYIIDEAHMLSTGAFNALLKILEEPPSHVIFILATTEVHKIPVTILSRCQRFDFHRINTKDITDRLLEISRKEPFDLDAEAASLIARLADGGMRDALSLLDQCAAYSSEVVLDTVTQAAGIADREYLYSFNQAVITRDAAKAFTLIDELHEKSKDLERLCEELIRFYRNLMIIKTTPGFREIISSSEEDLGRMQELCENLKLSQIIHCLTVLQDSMKRFGRSVSKRLELEICFAKLCSPKLDKSLDSVLRRLDRIESQIKYNETLRIPSQQSDESNNENVNGGEQAKGVGESAQNAEPIQNRSNEINSSSANKPETLECWQDIIIDLSENAGMLYGALVGSQAFVAGDRLLIHSPNTALKDVILGKKNVLDEVIKRYTGRNFRIMMKSVNKQEKTSEESPLGQVLEKASRSGVPVVEE